MLLCSFKDANLEIAMEEEIQKSLASFEVSEDEKKTMEDILWSMTNYLRLEKAEEKFRKIALKTDPPPTSFTNLSSIANSDT